MKQIKIIQAIQVDNKNIADIFKLPCVQSIDKTSDGSFFVRTSLCHAAFKSDWLCQHDDGSWHILDDDEYQSLRLLF